MSGTAPQASRKKPWLSLYSGRPETLDAAFSDMLEVFRSTATRHPANIAIRYFGRSIDYATLDRMSDSLACWLHTHAVVKGDRVALLLQNIPQFAIAVLAIWKTGAIAVPLNPMYRPAELSRLFDDFEPKVVICEETVARFAEEALASSIFTVPTLLSTRSCAMADAPDERALGTPPADSVDDAFLREIDRHSDASLPALRAAPEDIAIILYTSGTTGLPKGAMLSHRNLAFNAEISRDWFGIRKGAGILAMAPLFHIIGFEVNFCAGLLAAATLVLTYRFEPLSIASTLVQERPTFMIGTITGFIALMNRPEVTADAFKSIESAYSGGAPVPASIVDQARARLGIDIRTAYGMTETAAPTHVTPFGSKMPRHSAFDALPIGIPVSSLEATIVRDDGSTAPCGEAGELWVSGPQVMSGYWNNPTETEETLKDGWLRTGDVALMDEAGWFYLVDRKKDMISAAGFKVWPREVEDTIYRHVAVREVAVIGVPDAYRGESVKAFVALKDGHSVSAAEIETFCRERLAPYKCPREIEFLPVLPKTVSGKIQRAALRRREAR